MHHIPCGDMRLQQIDVQPLGLKGLHNRILGDKCKPGPLHEPLRKLCLLRREMVVAIRTRICCSVVCTCFVRRRTLCAVDFRSVTSHILYLHANGLDEVLRREGMSSIYCYKAKVCIQILSKRMFTIVLTVWCKKNRCRQITYEAYKWCLPFGSGKEPQPCLVTRSPEEKVLTLPSEQSRTTGWTTELLQ